MGTGPGTTHQGSHATQEEKEEQRGCRKRKTGAGRLTWLVFIKDGLRRRNDTQQYPMTGTGKMQQPSAWEHRERGIGRKERTTNGELALQ